MSSRNPSQPHVAPDPVADCSQLRAVISDPARYRIFLSQRDESAQALLDLVQAVRVQPHPVLGPFKVYCCQLLDYPLLDPSLRNPFVNALLRLSTASGLHPKNLIIVGVRPLGDYAVAWGKYGDIWQGLMHGEKVAVKVIRLYANTDRKKTQRLNSRHFLVKL